jgi:hypothetical protein
MSLGLLRLGRMVTEAVVLGYLLCIPLGQSIGASGRNLALLAIVFGMVLARLPGGLDRPPALSSKLLNSGSSAVRCYRRRAKCWDEESR